MEIENSKCTAMFVDGMNSDVDPMGHISTIGQPLVGSLKRMVL